MRLLGSLPPQLKSVLAVELDDDYAGVQPLLLVLAVEFDALLDCSSELREAFAAAVAAQT
eukprot:gene31682-6884_t